MKVGFYIAEAFTGRTLTGDRIAIVPGGARAMRNRLRAPGP